MGAVVQYFSAIELVAHFDEEHPFVPPVTYMPTEEVGDLSSGEDPWSRVRDTASRKRVYSKKQQRLEAHVAENGYEPLDVVRNTPAGDMLADGHHRYWAGVHLRQDSLPVREWGHPDDYWAARNAGVLGTWDHSQPR